jgi:hypothetical protein
MRAPSLVPTVGTGQVMAMALAGSSLMNTSSYGESEAIQHYNLDVRTNQRLRTLDGGGHAGPLCTLLPCVGTAFADSRTSVDLTHRHK